MAKSDEQTVAAPSPGRLSGVLELPAAPAEKAAAQETFIRIAVLGGLFIWLHWGLLDWLVQSWWQNPNWSHGFLLPVFSAYLLYCRWGELRALKPLDFSPRAGSSPWPLIAATAAIALLGALVWFGLHLGERALSLRILGVFWPAALVLALWVGRPCRAGLVLVVLFLEVEVAIMAIRPNNWLLGLSMVGMLFGLAMYFNGPRAMRLLWLPILFLCLAIPIPESQYNKLAYPLQEVAAAGSRGLLGLLGVEITRKASNLQLTTVSGKLCDLTVAEACSGMRLLMAFFALGVATAYLGIRPLWQRITLVAAAVPIAVLCNVLRVTITGWMYYLDRPQLGKGVLHTATGMLMLIPAFILLWVLGWLLEGARWVGNRLFEEEEVDAAEAVEPVTVRAHETCGDKGDGS